MSEENISQEFRMKNNKDETRNYLTEEINQNKLMSKKHKKVHRVLNYIEYLLILISTVTGCVFISAFAFFIWFSYKNDKFCNRTKHSCNNCRN